MDEVGRATVRRDRDIIRTLRRRPFVKDLYEAMTKAIDSIPGTAAIEGTTLDQFWDRSLADVINE